MCTEKKSKTKAKKNRRRYKDGDYQKLAEEIIRPSKDKRAAKETAQGKSKKKGLRLASDKALAKELRLATKEKPTRRSPFVAVLTPTVIVPDNAEEAPLVADAGSIVRMMDQQQLYRSWTSPITRRSDEWLVQYGPPKKISFGWIAQSKTAIAKTAQRLKETKPPTFLVRTKSEDTLSAWERLRLLVAQARKRDARYSLATWLATNGSAAEHQRLIREVTREFGGKTVKNEPYADRFQRLCSLILQSEIDMASAKLKKSSKKVKGKKTVEEAPAKKSKKGGSSSKSDKKVAKKPAKASDFSPRSHDFDQHIIRRLIKENPRKAGSNKAKIWAKLHKGMTVEQFSKKGGSRSVVAFYIRNGWIKLLAPSGASAAE